MRERIVASVMALEVTERIHGGRYYEISPRELVVVD